MISCCLISSSTSTRRPSACSVSTTNRPVDDVVHVDRQRVDGLERGLLRDASVEILVVEAVDDAAPCPRCRGPARLFANSAVRWLFRSMLSTTTMPCSFSLRDSAEREGIALLARREILLVAARHRSVDRAALAPQRAPDAADAGAAGALLLPQLLAGARNLGARLGLVGAATQAGEVRLDGDVDQVLLVRVPEHRRPAGRAP